MSVNARLWLRIAITTAVALSLLLAVSPATPRENVPPFLQLPCGAAAGILLFAMLTRCRPAPAPRPTSLPVFAARCGVLGLLAVNEEILWRRIALGELLFGGIVASLAATTVGFALAHRGRTGTHLLTGGMFGALYVGTGGLAACVAAHWIYNLLVRSFAVVQPRVGDGSP